MQPKPLKGESFEDYSARCAELRKGMPKPKPITIRASYTDDWKVLIEMEGDLSLEQQEQIQDAVFRAYGGL